MSYAHKYDVTNLFERKDIGLEFCPLCKKCTDLECHANGCYVGHLEEENFRMREKLGWNIHKEGDGLSARDIRSLWLMGKRMKEVGHSPSNNIIIRHCAFDIICTNCNKPFSLVYSFEGRPMYNIYTECQP
jgi:hypothetical protein